MGAVGVSSGSTHFESEQVSGVRGKRARVGEYEAPSQATALGGPHVAIGRDSPPGEGDAIGESKTNQ